MAVFIIHSSFSYVTQPSWIPDLTFSINTNYIHSGKHGSDTESYDTEVSNKMELKKDRIESMNIAIMVGLWCYILFLGSVRSREI